MSNINKGNQSIVFDFKHPLKGSEFNKLFKGIFQPGIYEGGELTNIGNEVYISPFSALINCDEEKTIKISTSSSVNLTISDSLPYIKMSFTWQDAEENWADFEASASYEITDVVFGKGLFSSGVCVGFDLTERTYGKRLNIEVDSYSPPLIVNSQIKVNNLNADLLDGKHAGNNDGDISINNGTLNNNLNADMFDGYHIDEFMLQHEGSYSEYYVQDTAPTTNHGTLWYNTTNNKLYKYNNILSKWIEINWQEIVKATPEWQAGKLQVSSGILQIYNGSSWFDCYPMVGSKFYKITDYTKKYYQQIGTFTAIVNSDQVPIVFAREMCNYFRVYSDKDQSSVLKISNITITVDSWMHFNTTMAGHGAYNSTLNGMTLKAHPASSGVCDFLLSSSNISTSGIEYHHNTSNGMNGVANIASNCIMPSTAYYLGVLDRAGTIIVERKVTI